MKYFFSSIIIIFVSFHIQSCGGCSNKRIEKPQILEKKVEIKPQVVEIEKPMMNIVKMLQEGDGVYRIPVLINDVQMKFIFDTGAGMISMSATEARFLYKQGTLTDEDFIETANFSDANGDITPGMVVRLRTVKIGNKTLENIKASIVDNDKAPLLLGQSALEKFGKISIDYNKSVLVFE